MLADVAIAISREKSMLDDPPLLTIRRQFARPGRALIAALGGAPTGNLVDAMDGRGALDYRIKPLDLARSVFAGPALTCQTGPSDNLALIAALAIAAPGDVVVVAADGFTGTGVVGDLVAGMARNRGVAALVVDGMVRDVAGILQVGLPVLALGVTPNSCVRSGPGTVGLPVVCGGVAVASGDVVVGDRDGAVIVPQAHLAAVAERLARIRAAEAQQEERVKAGLGIPDYMAALLASDRVRYLD
jgi:4-hydroxy-4-methyl-2-oxoglutarate aldolase